MGDVEDAIRTGAQHALSELHGIDVQRMSGGWGFYHRGLLFAAAWDGAFRFRHRRHGQWVYDPVTPALLDDHGALVAETYATLAVLRTPDPPDTPA
jgi:TfoX/Sxy family transcriptional regulator of competence genes